ncbi:cyanate hydratase, partial [Nostoc muscorum FACHB-395]|nr:cyanate hydratase [Desmonostoc muscorum FACHB-395]MBD2513408.1 cyanate hydratase [Desmonostoc muscorum FACHB-395]
MSIPEITQKLLTAKENKGLTFAELAEVLQCNEVWIASV